MNQPEIAKLVSKLRIKVPPKLRKFSNPKGPEERLNKIRKTVNDLIKYERIELNYQRADESRMYAERLISDAIRYGDCHKKTMDIANYWLIEKDLIHKLFKVLVSRYQNYKVSYTRMYKAPVNYESNIYNAYPKAILELRGNPFPALAMDSNSNRNLIHNILLDEAKRKYRMNKYKEVVDKLENVEISK